MYELAPSVYAADYLNLKEQIGIIEKGGSGYLHIDIMDGHFVPGLSFGPGFVSAIRNICGLTLDVHLMVEEPGRFIQDFLTAGADIITMHVEVKEDLKGILDLIHGRGKKAGIVLKPSTLVKEIKPELWERIDVIQIMTVEPGLGGQTFIPESYMKIQEVEDRIRVQAAVSPDHHIDLEVDGDITPMNLRQVLDAGANIIVAGKGLFAGSLPENINLYQSILEEGGQRAVFSWN